jgi:DHA1 family tetracycline resistance protein-like MFS transporter
MQKGRLASIFLVVFIDLLGFGLILPLLPYFAGQYGASQFVVGTLVASYALAQFIGAPLLGRLSDRFGRRPILMVSIAGTALSFLVLGLAEPVGTALARLPLAAATGDQLAALESAAVLGVMFISRFMAGLTGGNITVAQAYISDVTDAQNRAKGLGMIGAAFGLGFILGPAIGGALSRWGYDVPSFAAAALATVNLIGVFFLLPESLTPERKAQLVQQPRSLISVNAMLEALTQPRIGPLMHIRLFFALAAALFQTMFTLWAKDRLGLSAGYTALLLAYVGLLSVVVQGGLIGPLTRRYSEYRLIFWSTAVQAVSLLFWAFTPSVPVLMVVMIPLAFSTGVLNTVVNAAITRAVAPQEIGGALGIAASLESLSRIVSPVVGGWLLGAVGTWAPGILAALIMAWVAAFAWRRLLVSPDPALPGSGEGVNQSQASAP